MGGDYSLAVAVIGAACLVVMGLLINYGPRWRPRIQRTTEPTTCANARAQQEYRRRHEL